MAKQETDPIKLRELRFSQPKASDAEMHAQIRAGIEWRRGSTKPSASVKSSKKPQVIGVQTLPSCPDTAASTAYTGMRLMNG